MRGIVMIIMALDHTRDFLHFSSITQSPTDLGAATPAIFLTRWITHLCAPTFVFLSGTSAFISLTNKGNSTETRKFLLIRGIWLIVLDFTLINFGLWFDIHFNVFLFDVLSAIGFGFIVLSFLLSASVRTIAVVGLGIVFLHNALPLLPLPETMLKKILTAFFVPGAFSFGEGKLFVMGYPPIPWLGIVLTGFAAGSIFLSEQAIRRRIFLRIGLSAMVLSLIIRFINVYGDSFPWSDQKTGIYTFLSFINFTKYPPSLVFTLFFVGAMFLILFVVEGMQNKFSAVTSVYGKVPLFYFVIHWYILHPIVFVVVFLQGYGFSDLLFGFNFGRPKGPSGLSLMGVYLIWIAVVALLYPLCERFARYKENHREKGLLRFI